MPSINYFVHPTAVIGEGAAIGDGTHVWHFCHIMRGAVIGTHCSLGQNVFVAEGVRLGDGCKVQNNVSLYTGVTCEAEVFLGPSCVFTNVINPRAAVSRKDQYRPTLVKKGASIGANATILCGTTIGEYALIAAGAVVTKDVAPYTVVAGMPAEPIGFISAYGEKLLFHEELDTASCSATGEKYLLRDGCVFPVSVVESENSDK